MATFGGANVIIWEGNDASSVVAMNSRHGGDIVGRAIIVLCVCA